MTVLNILEWIMNSQTIVTTVLLLMFAFSLVFMLIRRK